MILIYVTRLNNRIRYIFRLIFGELLRCGFRFTTQRDEFENFDGVKLNYSRQNFSDELYFASSDLLFEVGIMGQGLNFIDFEGSKTLYPVFHKQSCLPFDPFAASFFLVTRYEEYLPYRKDQFGRFPARESCSSQQGFLRKPVVNLWARCIAALISERYPSFRFPEKKYRFVPSFDIDAYYAYKLKGLVRTAGGYWNSFTKGEFSDIHERTRVLTGLAKDPFDTFHLQWQLQEKYNLRPVYFILFADYGQYDKNLPAYNPKFQVLIKELGDHADVGIHPSFASADNPEKLREEVENLSKVLNKEITQSRQHFLRLNLPLTYRNLINLDIREDYSMGYASETGFRAGICDPFTFYDLDLDIETKLRIHPFALMDGTFRDYYNCSAEEALEQIRQMVTEVKAVNGTFISLWHNESLSDRKRWTGWRYIYEEMLKAAIP